MNNATRHITKIASVIAVAVGCFALAGWVFNIPTLTSVVPGWASMKFNTALCFVLSGLSLYLLGAPAMSEHRKTVASVSAWIVLIIGFLSISEYLFGYNAHIDELFWKAMPEAGPITFPGRMSELTASSFAILGIILLLLKKGKNPWLIVALLYVVATFSTVTLFIYFFNVPFLNDIPLLATDGPSYSHFIYRALHGYFSQFASSLYPVLISKKNNRFFCIGIPPPGNDILHLSKKPGYNGRHK